MAKYEARIVALEKALLGQTSEITEIKARLDKLESAFSEVRLGSESVFRVKCEKGDEALRRVDETENSVGNLGSEIKACSLKLCELEQAWPALSANSAASYAATVRKSPRGKASNVGVGHRKVTGHTTKATDSSNRGASSGSASKRSFGDQLRSSKDKVLVIGDSLARGAGSKLVQQCGVAARFNATSGAKLRFLGERVKNCGDENTHIVMIAGANDVGSDSTSADLIDEFVETLRVIKSAKCKSLTVVGLTKRYGSTGLAFNDRKRKLVNARVSELCFEAGFKFLNFDPLRSDVHEDGLHFNASGQVKLARKIFQHCKFSCEAFLA